MDESFSAFTVVGLPGWPGNLEAGQCGHGEDAPQSAVVAFGRCRFPLTRSESLGAGTNPAQEASLPGWRTRPGFRRWRRENPRPSRGRNPVGGGHQRGVTGPGAKRRTGHADRRLPPQ